MNRFNTPHTSNAGRNSNYHTTNRSHTTATFQPQAAGSSSSSSSGGGILTRSFPGVCPGLMNLGNSCYINSVVQALTASPYLPQFAQARPHRRPRTLARPGDNQTGNSGFTCPNAGALNGGVCVLCLVEAHLAAAWLARGTVAGGGGGTLTPRSVVNNLRHISPHLRPFAQEDAHEFLRLLVDAMQRSCLSPQNDHLVATAAAAATGSCSSRQGVVIGPAVGPAIGPALPPSLSQTGDSKPFKAAAYPFALFQGALQSCVTCSACGAKSKKVDPVEDLGLEISPATHSLEGALRHHTKPETLEGDNAYRCDSTAPGGCRGKHVTASRAITLHDVPPLLVIQLKRFVFSGQASMLFGGTTKVAVAVDFKPLLKLDAYLSPETRLVAMKAIKHRRQLANRLTNRQQPPQQSAPQQSAPQQPQEPMCVARLYAVVVHQGNSVHSGHYYCYVRARHDDDAADDNGEGGSEEGGGGTVGWGSGTR